MDWQDLWDNGSDEDIELSLVPKPYEKKPINKRIAVVDCETDPFAPEYLIKPFAVGFLTEDSYIDFWGDDCIDQFFAYLATLEDEYIIYAHNGGKFDFFFFLKYLDHNTSPMIMNGRLVKIFFQGQEFRDSFAIIPEALAKYKKTEIDYKLFVPEKREKHKKKILAYQKDDCVYLYEQVSYFLNMFGDTLTIASAALRMLNSYHGFERFTSNALDEKFRAFYYGGRNQCFETGILYPRSGKWKMIDRNSMYPAVMRDCLHPIGTEFELQDTITDETDFACIVAHNRGALPVRLFHGGLDFTCEYGEFYATIHEINAGLATGTLDIEQVKYAWSFKQKSTFAEFINDYYAMRLGAKDAKDLLLDVNTKRVMNSSYGKFALNPRKFKKWLLTDGEIPSPLASEEYPDGWTMHSHSGDMYIWERPAPRRNGFYNVATAASITGAARANLLLAIAQADRPIYCDTDSIICENWNGETNDRELGGWKVEAEGDIAAIAGKKLYAVFNAGVSIKKASKGCQLTPEQIMQVCTGEEIKYVNPVPAFSLKARNKDSREFGEGAYATFIDRTIRMTGGKTDDREKRLATTRDRKSNSGSDAIAF